ncbi:MAG: glycosyltransferase family 9 protein [Rhodospirillales bacterium]|nr:glycosyltransferase family 9 protein [Alphaproteobacteria bacterium]MBL6948552.1 glycosyltransferase family 9 protein [Rhodospirillales bacterium]
MNANPAAGILVIKLGAMGDFVQALGPFAAIRRHHNDAHIVLLTTPPYRELAQASGYFDEVWTKGRPGKMDIAGWFDLRRRLRGGGFDRVYDLQTSDRSSFYMRLFWPGPIPEWSGIASGCSHPHANPDRDAMHTIERQAEQLVLAGIPGADIPEAPPVDLAALGQNENISRFGLGERYGLLAPGGAPHRPEKRWPAARFAELAKDLAERGLTPVLLGGAGESALTAEITALCPEAQNLAGQTSLLDLVSLAQGAVAAVGNDTGPMHLIAAAGCPSVVLFSKASDPALCGQRGASVTILRRDALSDLSVAEVVDALAL